MLLNVGCLLAETLLDVRAYSNTLYVCCEHIKVMRNVVSLLPLIIYTLFPPDMGIRVTVSQ